MQVSKHALKGLGVGRLGRNLVALDRRQRGLGAALQGLWHSHLLFGTRGNAAADLGLIEVLAFTFGDASGLAVSLTPMVAALG
jgi:hypothetical protein